MKIIHNNFNSKKVHFLKTFFHFNLYGMLYEFIIGFLFSGVFDEKTRRYRRGFEAL